MIASAAIASPMGALLVVFLLCLFSLPGIDCRACGQIECLVPPSGLSSCSRPSDCTHTDFALTSKSPPLCTCLNVLPRGCVAVNSSSPPPKLTLPPPEVANEGVHVVSAVVPRFFEGKEFRQAGVHISNVYINSRFVPGSGKTCAQQHGVELFVYTNGQCLLRARVTLPGIDHVSDDHYYYDDKSPMEHSFSSDYFFGASSAEFWIDATRSKKFSIPGHANDTSSIEFRVLMKSPIVTHRFSPSPRSVPRSLDSL